MSVHHPPAAPWKKLRPRIYRGVVASARGQLRRPWDPGRQRHVRPSIQRRLDRRSVPIGIVSSSAMTFAARRRAGERASNRANSKRHARDCDWPTTVLACRTRAAAQRAFGSDCTIGRFGTAKTQSIRDATWAAATEFQTGALNGRAPIQGSCRVHPALCYPVLPSLVSAVLDR
jgi:hypothetical protein